MPKSNPLLRRWSGSSCTQQEKTGKGQSKELDSGFRRNDEPRKPHRQRPDSGTRRNDERSDTRQRSGAGGFSRVQIMYSSIVSLPSWFASHLVQFCVRNGSAETSSLVRQPFV